MINQLSSGKNSVHIFHSEISNRISELSKLHEEIKILAGEMKADFGKRNLSLYEKIDVLCNIFQDDFVETQKEILDRKRREIGTNIFYLAYRPSFYCSKKGLREQNTAIIESQHRGIEILKNFLNPLVESA